MYLYLTSEESAAFHTSTAPGYECKNTSTNFLVSLPSSYYFGRNETWEIGLVDLYIDISQFSSPATQEILDTVIYIYCDCVEPSIFNTTEKPILNYTRVKDCTNSVFYPSVVRYKAIAQDRLCSIRVYIKKEDGSELPLVPATTRCTLHIQKTQ